MPDTIVTKLDLIRRYAEAREDENFRFRTYVKHRLKMDDKALDSLASEITDSVWSQIDCTACANCCKTLEPAVDLEDIERLAKHFGTNARAFERRYVKLDQ